MDSTIVIVEITQSIVAIAEGIERSVAVQDVQESIVSIVEGPKGSKGDTGEKGDKGDPGDVVGLSWNEAPTGVIDGVNAEFTLAGAPATPAKLLLTCNGLLLSYGAANDFLLTSSIITFNAGAIPEAGDTLLATYSTV
jgi:hypothetical protein